MQIIPVLSMHRHIPTPVGSTEGRLVKPVIDMRMAAGHYSYRWDGKDERDIRVARGIYICVLRTPNFVSIRKMIKTHLSN